MARNDELPLDPELSQLKHLKCRMFTDRRYIASTNDRGETKELLCSVIVFQWDQGEIQKEAVIETSLLELDPALVRQGLRLAIATK